MRYFRNTIMIRYKIYTQKSMAFLYRINNQLENINEKYLILNSNKIYKIPRYKFNKEKATPYHIYRFF